MPTAQRKETPTPRRQNVTYSLSRDTIRKIEELAAHENRNKSNMLAEIIDRYVAYNTPAKS